MDAFFLVVDSAGLIECASRSAAAAFGYDPAELSGLPLARVLDLTAHGEPTSVSSWLSASQTPVLDGIHRSGRRFTLRLTQQETRGAGLKHQVLYLQDANQRPAPETIFATHQDLYELATQQGRISVWGIDYRTNHLEFSPVLADMLGMSAAQIPTTVDGWSQVFHPDDWRGLEEQTDWMLHGERSEINIECRVFHVDGSTRWILVRGKAYFDEDGRPIKTLGTGIDITERKHAEEERDLFFTMSLDLLSIAGTNGYFLRVNPAFKKALGYYDDELTSRPYTDFVHPEDLAATEKAAQALAEGEDIIGFENRYRCKDGTWRWLSWTCPAVLPGAETVYAIARDVTEAKRVAAELEEAVQEARRANRAKSEFLSRMSHELRTPLNAILGFGQLLQRDGLTSRQRQQIEMIVNAGRHLLNLINEVLDIARIEAGRLDLSLESVELPELIDEVVNLAQPMAELRGISIQIDRLSVADRCMLADKQRLKQVLLNLVTNAIKYNTGHGRVMVRGEESTSGRFRVAVQDTGPGIPLDKQRRLFTPFDRLGAETTSIEGSGLGLVLSKRLIEVMGGELTFASEFKTGATFRVELAASPCPPSQQLAAVQAVLAPAFDAAARTLLYIEDNLANVKLIEAVLAYRPGIRLITAMAGGLGFDLASQHRPDLILLDVHLPDMVGQEFLTHLRGDPFLRKTPVVVVSADATSPQIDRLLDAGAKDYLTKPIDVEHFLRVVDRYLNHHQPA